MWGGREAGECRWADREKGRALRNGFGIGRAREKGGGKRGEGGERARARGKPARPWLAQGESSEKGGRRGEKGEEVTTQVAPVSRPGTVFPSLQPWVLRCRCPQQWSLRHCIENCGVFSRKRRRSGRGRRARISQSIFFPRLFRSDRKAMSSVPLLSPPCGAIVCRAMGCADLGVYVWSLCRSLAAVAAASGCGRGERGRRRGRKVATGLLATTTIKQMLTAIREAAAHLPATTGPARCSAVTTARRSVPRRRRKQVGGG